MIKLRDAGVYVTKVNTNRGAWVTVPVIGVCAWIPF